MGAGAASSLRRGGSTPAAIAASIRDRALGLGFSAVGIAHRNAADAAAARVGEFFAAGRHGTMAWMERAERTAPATLFPAARSVIAVGVNAGPAEDPLTVLAQRTRGAIATYARGRDYHDLVRAKLKRLARWLCATYACDAKVFVDTAPVLEKPLAAAAGLGWQGKHTNLVSREFGSWLLLGEVFTTLDLPADAPVDDACGTCSRCLDVCPTSAFPAPYQLDARRCISYLTIEHAGTIAPEFRAPMGNRIFGCDDCLAVCPWNKYAQAAHDSALLPRESLTAPLLADLASFDDAQFRAFASTSTIKRIGRDRFVRNVLIAIGNSGAAALVPTVLRLLGDAAPVVRAMAVWALGRLDAPAWRAQRAMRYAVEADADVRAEWDRTP